MTIKIGNLVVVCDGGCAPYNSQQAGYCSNTCRAHTEGLLLSTGGVATELPAGWTQEDDKVFGPMCSERRAMAKIMQAEVPDPEKDPPKLKEQRKKSVEIMRSVIKEDLEGKSDLQEKIQELRNQVSMLTDDESPDFTGTYESEKVEVRVKAELVEISWPGTVDSLTSITVRHKDLVLVNPPPFLDKKLVEWINGCLKTMEGDLLPADARLVN